MRCTGGFRRNREHLGAKQKLVIVRAMKAYLASEGKEIRNITKARRAIEDGQGSDLEAVIEQVDTIIKGAAA